MTEQVAEGSWVSPNRAARLVRMPARTIRYRAMRGLIAAEQDVNGYWSVLVVRRDDGKGFALGSWKKLANLANGPKKTF